MKSRLACFVFALVLISNFAPAIVRAEAETETTKLFPIFNGQDLSGWTAKDMNRFWRVDQGVLVGANDDKLSGSYLWTEKEYSDFVLEFDVRWTGEIDSGIEFRKPSIQLQLGVSRSLKRDMSGSFYVGKPGYPVAGQAREAAKLMHAEGQWNAFRLVAKGPTFTVWINGQKAAEYTDGNFTGASPLGLQIHAGLKMKVEYRNLRAAAL